MRALRACIQNNVSVANLSYGAPVSYSNKGAFFDELRSTFLKHRMLFITSAGNSGPALTTVNAPGSLADYCLSVGAYAAPASHEPLYSLDQELPEINHTWSSRGPTLDGARGVDVCAPGVAITSVHGVITIFVEVFSYITDCNYKSHVHNFQCKKNRRN